MRIALAVALVLLAPPTAAPAADAEPSASELAERAAAQAFGGDAIEVWKSEWQGRELVFGIARRHEAGRLELFLRVLSPHEYEPLSFLLRARDGGDPAIEYYRSPKLFPQDRRTGLTLEVQVASAIEGLPFVPGLPALADLWPRGARDFRFARLADASVAGVPCRVLESRPLRADGAYDRVVTMLARDSDVALESSFYLGERLVRKITVAPDDVERSDGRAVARRRVVERPGDAPQTLSLARFSPDPVFPDQLFTSSNLRTGRFPSY